MAQTLNTWLDGGIRTSYCRCAGHGCTIGWFSYHPCECEAVVLLLLPADDQTGTQAKDESQTNLCCCKGSRLQASVLDQMIFLRKRIALTGLILGNAHFSEAETTRSHRSSWLASHSHHTGNVRIHRTGRRVLVSIGQHPVWLARGTNGQRPNGSWLHLVIQMLPQILHVLVAKHKDNAFG